jgi:dihydroorotate dehydrogenase (NAD+) catalytic subunit
MSDVDLCTDLAGLTLPNPVMVAAGCAVAGRELTPFLDPAALGAFVTRSITLDPCAGWPTPRLLETPSGVLSAVGLQNPGLQAFLATELPWLAHRRARTIVSIAGTTLGQYAELARHLGNAPGVCGIEVNLAAPNEEANGRAFGREPYQAAKVLAVVRRDVPRGIPVLAKLDAAPDVADVARAVVKAGADAVVLVNAVAGLAIDPATLRPALGTPVGGLSGPAIHAQAVRCVWEVHAALPGLPVVGVGGISTGFDALEMLLAGATAVQVGTAVLHDPGAPAHVLAGLERELTSRGIHRVVDVVGRAHIAEGEHR